MKDDELEDGSGRPIQSAADEQEITPQAKPEKRGSGIMARMLRWLLGILVLIGIGSALVLVTLYMPLRNELHRVNKQLEAQSSESTMELETANQEINRLSSLEGTNSQLQEELAQAKTRLAVLILRLDIANAQLALNAGENSSATLALSKTSDTLKELEMLLPPDLRSLVADMQSRLKLILAEIESDSYAALSDLDVLANSLLTLESKLNQ